MKRPAISEMTPRDLDRVVEIAAEAFRPPWTRQAFVDELARAVSLCRVIRDPAGAPIAYAIAWVIAGEQEVLAIATDPAHRRQGLAGHLLEDLLAEGRARGATECFLEVRAGNQAAIALYRAHGFDLHDVRARYYDDGEDAWIMVRRARQVGA